MLVSAPVAEIVGRLSGVVAELVAAGALAGGAFEAFRNVRAKTRARLIAKRYQLVSSKRVDGDGYIKAVLSQLPEGDRLCVEQALNQQSSAAKLRYLKDILPSEVFTSFAKDEGAPTHAQAA